MKLFREILSFALVATALFATGCDKESEVQNTEKQNMAVTYYTIDGVWQLVEWNDAPLAEGVHLYLKLDRKEHRFDMWDNLNSMYTVMRSGSFVLSVDDMQQDIISGRYDYSVGDWSDDYIVELNADGDKMTWRAVSSDEKMSFVEKDAIPEF